MSQTAKHTPGPWVTRQGYITGDAQGQVYTSVASLISDASVVPWPFGRSPGQETATANARLIAAAPELLEAAQMLIDSLEGRDVEPEEAIGAIRAAVAKATGGAA